MDQWGLISGCGLWHQKSFCLILRKTGDGHIINISSLFGLTAQPTQSAYNATKFAVRGFTESLRQELDMENCRRERVVRASGRDSNQYCQCCQSE